MMGGSIGVESEHDVGSNFWAVVPFKIEAAKEKEADTALQDTKILVCDAHPFSRRAVRNTLLRLSATVYTTGDFGRLQPMLAKAVKAEQAYDLLALGLSAEESETHMIEEVLTSVRFFYDGPLLILVSSHTCNDSEPVTSDALVSVITKPARRDALLMNIQRLLGETVCELYEAEDTIPDAAMETLVGLRVLVAEDNVFNRSLIQTYLEKLGIKPVLAENGEEAFKYASEQEFDIIFLDIHMPVMDGIEAAERIRRLDNGNEDAPIVAMTADVFIREDKEVDTHSFSDYLFKPLKSEELVTVIYRQLKQEVIDACRQKITDEVELVKREEKVSEQSSKKEAVNADIPEHLIDKLIQELPVQLENLVEAYRSEDILMMREHAHQLYGLCGYFGVQKLGESTRILQDALHDEDMEKISATLEEVSQNIADIVSGEARQ